MLKKHIAKNCENIYAEWHILPIFLQTGI